MATTSGTRMAEVDFARQFLSACDRTTPVRASDFVKDQRKYPARPPTLLPPIPGISFPTKQHSFAADPSALQASSLPAPDPDEKATSVTITSLKPPKSMHVISPVALSTSILDLKVQLASLLSVPADSAPSRIRLLHKRRPVSDAKIVKDILFPSGLGDDQDAEVLKAGLELSFMVSKEETTTTTAAADVKMGDAPAVAPKVIDTSEFWDDLHGFLLQRLTDEGEAKKLVQIFREAVSSAKS